MDILVWRVDRLQDDSDGRGAVSGAGDATIGAPEPCGGDATPAPRRGPGEHTPGPATHEARPVHLSHAAVTDVTRAGFPQADR
jgi:hypothetical protein